ncbi:hypothetical protein IPG41_04255 [Candidatus Peregrinibacteria bacterium]|nr:MAG: hypothetical protein IPG41_04255 [Candidatus Peregrinibacteria bacterium]
MAKTKIKALQLKVRIPKLILDIRGADPKLLEELAPALENLDARVRILGPGLKTLPHAFSLEEALEEAHVWVVLAPHLAKDFSMVAERGIVPVMREGLHQEAENYNPVQENGNAFLFHEPSAWQIYGAIVRATENFAFSYDWENLRSQGRCLMERV